MEQQSQQQYQGNPYQHQNIYGGQQALPNATAILVLGICSIVICSLGPILGTIALVLAKGARKELEANPQRYTEGSVKNMNTGKICGIIGLCIGLLVWVIWAVYLIWAWYMMSMVIDQMDQIQHMPH